MPARGRIYIEVTPEPALVAEVFFMKAQKMQNLDEPLQAGTGVVDQEIAANFAAQGRPTQWEPLSQATIEARVWRSLSDSQKTALIDLRYASMGFGTLTYDPETKAPIFEQSLTTKYHQVMAGLASGMQILIDTGFLRDSATSGANWKYRRLASNSQAMELTDPTGYGGFHIEGNSRLPIRDWSYVSPEGVDQITEIMAEWVMAE